MSLLLPGPAINLQGDTGPLQKCMSLHPCVLEAHLALKSGDRDIWQGAIHSDLLGAKSCIIKQDQNLVKHGHFLILLYKVLKHAITEFVIPSLYFYEKRSKEFIYKNPQRGRMHTRNLLPQNHRSSPNSVSFRQKAAPTPAEPNPEGDWEGT